MAIKRQAYDRFTGARIVPDEHVRQYTKYAMDILNKIAAKYDKDGLRKCAD